MRLRRSGAFLFLISCTALAGCATALTQREAQSYAVASLNRYCTQVAPCGARRISGAQRLKQGWLIDIESSSARYGVMVHDDRATDVSVWQKNAPPAPGG